MALVSSGIFWLSVPRSGFASTATTRSPRSEANVAPSVAVIVVLPTPPLRLSSAILWQPRSGALIRAISSRRRMSAGLSPGLISRPDSTYTSRRQPDCGGRFAGRSSRADDRSVG